MAKILIVDDIEANRALLVTLVDHLGHQAFQAADGAEAVALARVNRPDLIISDILMPTMDGYEFVRQLRADATLAGTEVIFYSAHYREREARSLASSCGVTRVLVKPCEPEVIIKVINEALAHVASPDPAAVPRDFNTEHLRLLTDKLAESNSGLEAANRRLGALSRLNLQLASERDPRLLLEKVCRDSRELVGASYAVLCARARHSGTRVLAISGIDQVLAGTLDCPDLSRGMLGRVFVERRAHRALNPDGLPTSVGLPPGYPPLHSMLAAPVVSLTQVFGWICLADKVGAAEFTAEDEQLLATLAAQAGRIYENGSLYAEARRRAEQLQAEIVERERLAAELSESRRRLNGILTSAMDAIVTIDDGRQIVMTNPAAESMFGYTNKELLGKPLTLLLPEHIREQQLVLQAAFGDAMGNRNGPLRLLRGLRKGGDEFPIEATVAKDESTGSRYFTAILRDITERAISDERIRRLNRVYAVISGINTLIVRVRDREELFREACRIAIDLGQFRMAWIGMIDPEQNRLVPVASMGAEPRFLEAVAEHFSGDGEPFSDSVAGRAIRERKAVIINDLQESDALIARERHLERGIRSMVVLPLLVADAAVGVIALYAIEPGFFVEEEMKLLQEMAGDIGFALDHIKKSERLTYLAYYDEVTGLPNRTLFLERVSQQLRASDEDQGRHMVGVVLLDIDRFRIVNDSLGRQAGDELLRQVAQRLQLSEIGFGDAARVGVNCFGVLIRATADVSSVSTALEQLMRKCFSKPYQLRESELRIAGKAGTAFYPLDGADAETLFRNAEAALKRAKALGELHLFYSPRMTEAVAGRLALEHQLRQALDREEFELYYQPKVNLGSGRLAGAEALLRWNNPRSGVVLPGQFIPILEETGLIHKVGRWVLRKAIEDQLRWRSAGLNAVRIAVNVSPLQLRKRGFISEIRQAVDIDPKAASGLELELTETLIMEDVKHSIHCLQSISELGVTVAVDDFGTGFSSLSYLARLPVNTLKIDRSFVIDMGSGPQGLALVSTIINLAHSLKLTVVAEGVETEEQSRLLRLLNCDQMQGFLFGRPVPAAVFEGTFLAQESAA